MDVRSEMAREVAGFTDGELEAELSFAGSFGDEVHENAALWAEVLTQERQHRETGEAV